jgi:hypothetical protein
MHERGVHFTIAGILFFSDFRLGTQKKNTRPRRSVRKKSKSKKSEKICVNSVCIWLKNESSHALAARKIFKQLAPDNNPPKRKQTFHKILLN